LSGFWRSPKSASAAPNYDEPPTAEGVKRFRERLLAAERVGAIVLRHGKRERHHLIERATVKDPVLLASHLGRKRAAERRTKSIERGLEIALCRAPPPQTVAGESTNPSSGGAALLWCQAVPSSCTIK
jgi:hypothetical protein